MASWSKLLSSERLGRRMAGTVAGRSPFEQDADLVVFSGAFRRLQDKTQVHTLSEEAQVRTRLTHSIEVASVGRSLGAGVAPELARRYGLDSAQRQALSQVVHAACLAHDIGNPPFGHGGEQAIQGWFQSHASLLEGVSEARRCDLFAFDGNAQGFRTLTQLENYRFQGGLQLTFATLGAFTKYPCDSGRAGAPGASWRKHGFFDAERGHAEQMREALALAPGVRHPLAWLMEAADDICYTVIDVEDGASLGLIDHASALEVLVPIAGRAAEPALPPEQQVHKLRGQAIGRLVAHVCDSFLEREQALLGGSAGGALLANTPLGDAVARASALVEQRVFRASAVLQRQLAGHEVLTGLLDTFAPVVGALGAHGWDTARLSGSEAALAGLLGEHLQGVQGPYEAWLALTDRLCAMTDRQAVSLYRRLKGIQL